MCGVYKPDPTSPTCNGVGLFCLNGKRWKGGKRGNGENFSVWWNAGQWRLGLTRNYWAVVDAPKTAYPPEGAVWTTKKGGGTLQIVWGSMQWGTKVRGPELEISGDGLTVSDVAKNPKKGGDNLGRYRPCVADISFKDGKHRISVKIVRPGRILVGMCTDAVKSTCREGTKNSIYQLES